MIEQSIVIAMVGLFSACLGALIALRFQRSYWKNLYSQHEGWEHAQEGHHRTWEEKQEKYIAEAEARFIAQVQQLRDEWHQWDVKDAERIAEHLRQQELSSEQARIERELARLPRVEETSMVLNNYTPDKQSPVHWRPAILQGAHLAGLDLSHRYLGRADLRNARLSGANLFMADLSGACLADADLTDADLSGANLANADLRCTTMQGANLQVADLNNAILTGANLLRARNLTSQQVYSTIYDSTTLLDSDIAITLPGITSMSNKHNSSTTPPTIESTSSVQSAPVEDEKARSDMLFEETMPALVAVKPELLPVIPEETPVPVVELHNDISDLPQSKTSSPVAEIPTDGNNLPQLEAPHSLAQITEEKTLETSSDDHSAEVPSASPISTAFDDTSLPAQEIHLLSESRTNNYHKEPVPPMRKAKRHGRKRAKVG